MGIVGTHVDGLEDMSSLPASRAQRRLLWFGIGTAYDNDTFRQRVAVDNRPQELRYQNFEMSLGGRTSNARSGLGSQATSVGPAFFDALLQ